MHLSDLLGKSAAILALIVLIPYIRSILQGKTKPNRASWLIWTVVNVSLLASYHYSGATTTIWLAASYNIISVTVFLLSLKYGVGGYAVLDIVCIVGALLGLVLWKLTDNPTTALYLNIFMDALGFLPTIKKAYLSPGSENTFAWSMSVVANVLNVCALTTWQLKIALFPIYNLTFNAVVAVLLFGIIQKKHRRAA